MVNYCFAEKRSLRSIRGLGSTQNSWVRAPAHSANVDAKDNELLTMPDLHSLPVPIVLQPALSLLIAGLPSFVPFLRCVFCSFLASMSPERYNLVLYGVDCFSRSSHSPSPMSLRHFLSVVSLTSSRWVLPAFIRPGRCRDTLNWLEMGSGAGRVLWMPRLRSESGGQSVMLKLLFVHLW